MTKEPSEPSDDAFSATAIMKHVSGLQREITQIHQLLTELRTGEPPQRRIGWAPPPSRTAPTPTESAPRIRVDAPHFNGEDPTGWISEVQRFFDYFYTPDDERMLFVSLLIDDPATEWFRYYRYIYAPDASWMEFLFAVKQRFDPDHFEDYSGPLSELQQETMAVADHTEDYSSPLSELQQETTPVADHTESETLLNKVSGADDNTVDFDDTWAPGHQCTTTLLMLGGTDSDMDSLAVGTHDTEDISTDSVPPMHTLSENTHVLLKGDTTTSRQSSHQRLTALIPREPERALSEPVPLPPPPDTVPETLSSPSPVPHIHLEDKVVSEDGGVDTQTVTRAPTRPVRDRRQPVRYADQFP